MRYRVREQGGVAKRRSEDEGPEETEEVCEEMQSCWDRNRGISTYANALWPLLHIVRTHTHTHTEAHAHAQTHTPVNSHPACFPVLQLGVSSISGCHPG